jgi:hypothetical protein
MAKKLGRRRNRYQGGGSVIESMGFSAELVGRKWRLGD